jgi:SCY1-like protein 2
MLAVASNLFGKSSSLAAYNLHSAPSPSSSSSNLPSTASPRSFNVGLWKVFGATHKTTSKEVSVWVFEKKIIDGVRMDGAGRTTQQAKEWVLEQLRKEVSGRLKLSYGGSAYT